MTQVIEVRFRNPANMELLHTSMTLASSHKEAIDLAMHRFSGGVGVVKSIQRVEGVEQGKKVGGAAFAWQYSYRCIVEEEEYDREMLAILFASYKEKEQEQEGREEND